MRRWRIGGIFTCARGGKGEYTHFACNAWLSREQLGDYGCFSDSGDFHCQGNLFADITSLNPEVDTNPRKQEMTRTQNSLVAVVDDSGQSLPTMLSTHGWLSFPLDLPMHISLQGLSNVVLDVSAVHIPLFSV